MFQKAKAHMDSHIFEIDSYDEFRQAMEETRGFVLSFWCGDPQCEEKIKEETNATVRVIPFEQPESMAQCVRCGKDGKHRVYFAKSY
jgi:prolyl-tRNA synthetase